MTPDDLAIPPEDEPPRRGGDRAVWYVVAGLVVLWIGYLVFFGPTRPEPQSPILRDPLLGQASFRWSLDDLDGNKVQLSDFRGRTIFLNIWATWCGPCLLEMPSIEALAKNPRLKDVVFLGVSAEDVDTLKEFFVGRETKLTILSSLDTPPAMYITQGIPATFIIAPEGRIAAAYVGAADWDEPEVVEFLADLAARATSPPIKVEPTTSGGS